ncbi:MAG: hypothetical protein ACI9FN_001720 [Saprospiraceae bacterium]|jgi:hypothetical protein
MKSHFFTWSSFCVLVIICSSFNSAYIPIVRQRNIEICDNGLDDDGDGLIDLNDSDCECPVIEPKSLIPNPSFEEQSCCPNDRAALNCATGWIQASAPTTDYVHTCGWPGPNEYFPPMPFPDGDGVMGFRDGRIGRDGDDGNPNWKEYAGACLLNPLEKDIAYRFEFELGFLNYQQSPPINVTFFGTTDCKNLPFGGGDDTFGCPSKDSNWVRLGDQFLTGSNNTWTKGSIEITPNENITAIAIGPDCNENPSTTNLYYYFDNLILSDVKSFEFKISEVGHPCSESFTLRVPEDEDLDYQWYKDGSALLNESAALLTQSYGEGEYQVRTIGQNSCRVTKSYTLIIPNYSFSTQITLCENEKYQFGFQPLDVSGVYTETFKNSDNCDSVVTLDLTVLPKLETSRNVKIFEGETYRLENYRFKEKGQYQAYLISSIGCDSLVNINLEYYNVYFPNVFNPHSYLGNDRFIVHGNEDLVEIKSLTVFDRWGKQIYDDADLLDTEGQGWGGTHSGSMVEPGIYAYITTLLMDDGIERQFTGSILVML